MAFWTGLRVLEWLLFRVKALTLLNASCFAAFLYYEQDNTVAIAHSLSFDPVRSIYSCLYSL
ncbi:hypothetical protein P20495_3251 [Pseudoalteromonas sp. BSi20495]|nr:hypothetical protein P20495_3251 [Pseudoalteromonas sp. BSi20495]